MRVLTAEELDWVSGGQGPTPAVTHEQQCQQLMDDFLGAMGTATVSGLYAIADLADASASTPISMGVAAGSIATMINIGGQMGDCQNGLKDPNPKPFPGDGPYPLPRGEDFDFDFRADLTVLPTNYRTV